jgi:hypothetical protein
MAPGLSGFSSILTGPDALETGTVRGPIQSLMHPCLAGPARFVRLTPNFFAIVFVNLLL